MHFREPVVTMYVEGVGRKLIPPNNSPLLPGTCLFHVPQSNWRGDHCSNTGMEKTEVRAIKRWASELLGQGVSQFQVLSQALST